MLKRWFSRPFAPPAPDRAITVIGDVHGYRDVLEQALETIPADQQIVCVGDYVDRGPDSAGVVTLLQSRPDIICLMGNHEEMMLRFLQDPRKSRWLHHGGLETVQSYGVSADGSATQVRDALRAAMGAEQEAWLRALPSYWKSGTVAVTHAGADPDLPIQAQSTKVLRWGHPKFGKRRRSDGLWVVRGHVIVDAPQAADGIIEIDTGIYRTGRLCLAHIDKDRVAFDIFSAEVLQEE